MPQITDELEKRIYEIHGDVREIKQHLTELNGSVAENTQQVESNTTRLNRYKGGLAVIGFLAVAATTLAAAPL